MKEYNRETKRYEEKSTEQVGVLKKRDMCKGKRPHEWKLIIPDYTNNHRNDDISQETVEKFYALMDEHHEMNKSFQAKVEVLGVNYRVDSFRPMTRMSRCAVCNKRDWGF